MSLTSGHVIRDRYITEMTTDTLSTTRACVFPNVLESVRACDQLALLPRHIWT